MPRRARVAGDVRGAGRAREPRAPEPIPRRRCELPVAVIASRSDEPAADPLVFPTAGGPGCEHLRRALVLPRLRRLGRRRSRHHPRRAARRRAGRADRSTAPSSTPSTSSSTACGSTGRRRRRRCAAQLTALPRPPRRGRHQPRRLHQRRERGRSRRPARGARLRRVEPLRGVVRLTPRDDDDARPPEGLRSVILDGTLPADVNRHELLPTGFLTALDDAVRSMRRRRGLRRDVPRPRRRICRAARQRRRRRRSRSRCKSPVDGSDVRLDIHDTDLARRPVRRAVRRAPRAGAALRHRPAVARQRRQRRSARAERGRLRRRLDGGAVPLGRVRRGGAVQRPRASSPRRWPRTRSWSISRSARTPRATARSGPCPRCRRSRTRRWRAGIPTLLTSGGYDPVTPLAFSEAAAARLSLALPVRVPDDGPRIRLAELDRRLPGIHRPAVPATIPAASRTRRASPRCRRPTSSRRATSTRRPRSTGSTADVVAGPRSGADRHRRRSSRSLLIATLVYALVYGISWLFRRRGGRPAGAVPVAATAAALYLAYAGGAGARGAEHRPADPRVRRARRRAPARHRAARRDRGHDSAGRGDRARMGGRRRDARSTAWCSRSRPGHRS